MPASQSDKANEVKAAASTPAPSRSVERRLAHQTAKPAKSAKAGKSSKADGSKKVQELDPSKLPDGEAKKRVAEIYRLERKVEERRAAYQVAKRHTRTAKAALTEAEDDLEREIREQRIGPGPLFNDTGTGPAKPASVAASAAK